MREKRKHHNLALATTVAILCLLIPQSHAANETAFIKLWQQHIKNPDQHAETIAACREFSANNRGDELVRVVKGIETWHLLKSNQGQEAMTMLDSDLSLNSRGTGAGATILARGWMSLIDIGPVKKALQYYYRQEVEYPESLDALAGNPNIPVDLKFRLRDRWDIPWKYRLVGFKSVPGFLNQRYSISSSRLDTTTDLTNALQLPYASEIHVRPMRTRKTGGNTVLVEFANWVEGQEEGRRFFLGAGRKSGNIFLAYVGKRMVIVCDQLHWKVLPKPAG